MTLERERRSLVGGPGGRYATGMSEPELPARSKGLLAEFAAFIVHEKIWWMAPIAVVLVGMVTFILFAEASPLLPYIYALGG